MPPVSDPRSEEPSQTIHTSITNNWYNYCQAIAPPTSLKKMNSGYLAFVQGERMVVLNQVGAWTLVFFKLLRIGKLEKEKQRDSHLTGHVKALGNKASFWNGYLGQSSQPVRDFVLVQVIPIKKNSGGVLL